MNLKHIKQNFYLHEVLTILFLIPLLVIYYKFNLNFEFIPALVYWFIVATIALGLMYFASKFFPITYQFVFKSHIESVSINSTKILKFLRVFLGVVFALVVYENLQVAIYHISPVDQDAALLFYDQLFFYKGNLFVSLQSYIHPLLTEWLNFAYISFFFYLPIFGMYFFIKDNLVEWARLTFILILCLFVGYILYIFFPAVGPGVYFSELFNKNLDGSFITNMTNVIVNTQGYAKGTFPSLHIACSTIYIYFAYRNSKILFWFFAPVIISLWVSTVYLRHHYIIDVFAGYCLAIICIFFGNIIYEKWNETNEKLLD